MESRKHLGITRANRPLNAELLNASMESSDVHVVQDLGDEDQAEITAVHPLRAKLANSLHGCLSPCKSELFATWRRCKFNRAVWDPALVITLIQGLLKQKLQRLLQRDSH